MRHARDPRVEQLFGQPPWRGRREIDRVSRRHKYLQVDSRLTEEQRARFERWQVTAVTYFDPASWRTPFQEAGYTGEYYWTITE